MYVECWGRCSVWGLIVWFVVGVGSRGVLLVEKVDCRVFGWSCRLGY